jgi:hypothetical protein
MTVGELKDALKDIPDDVPVTVLASDGELDWAVSVFESSAKEYPDDSGSKDIQVLVVAPN